MDVNGALQVSLPLSWTIVLPQAASPAMVCKGHQHILQDRDKLFLVYCFSAKRINLEKLWKRRGQRLIRDCSYFS